MLRDIFIRHFKHFPSWHIHPPFQTFAVVTYSSTISREGCTIFLWGCIFSRQGRIHHLQPTSFYQMGATFCTCLHSIWYWTLRSKLGKPTFWILPALSFDEGNVSNVCLRSSIGCTVLQWHATVLMLGKHAQWRPVRRSWCCGLKEGDLACVYKAAFQGNGQRSFVICDYFVHFNFYTKTLYLVARVMVLLDIIRVTTYWYSCNENLSIHMRCSYGRLSPTTRKCLWAILNYHEISALMFVKDIYASDLVCWVWVLQSRERMWRNAEGVFPFLGIWFGESLDRERLWW